MELSGADTLRTPTVAATHRCVKMKQWHRFVRRGDWPGVPQGAHPSRLSRYPPNDRTTIPIAMDVPIWGNWPRKVRRMFLSLLEELL